MKRSISRDAAASEHEEVRHASVPQQLDTAPRWDRSPRQLQQHERFGALFGVAVQRHAGPAAADATTQLQAVGINDDSSLEHEADARGTEALQMRADHSKECGCASCHGARPQSAATATTDAEVSQRVLQLVCPICHKKKGHKSNCERNKKVKTAVAKTEKKLKEQNSSWVNMQCYRSGWVTRNDITEAKVKAFCAQYGGRRIRGHCTSANDKDAKEHKNTERDLNAYKSWHTQTYGAWK